jgi:hypothetical protein
MVESPVEVNSLRTYIYPVVTNARRPLSKDVKRRIFFFALLIFLLVLNLFTLHRLNRIEAAFKEFTSIEVPVVPPVPEEIVPVREPRYGFTDQDIYLLAQLLCGSKDIDGDGEYDFDFKTKINHVEVGKVLGVVMNRVRDNQFPNTVKGVVLQKNQFSVMPRNASKVPSKVAVTVVQDWCERYDNYDKSVQVIPENHLYFTGNGRINITRVNYR